MGLSQTELDMVAQETELMYGSTMEQVTIAHRATASATPVVYGPFPAKLVAYSDHVVAMHALTAADRPQVLRDDCYVRLATAVVTWVPTIYDEVLRADMTRWRVLSIRGGPMHPFYIFQVRSIPL